MKKLVAVTLIAGLISVMGAQAASAQLLDVSAEDLEAGVFPEGELAALSGSGYPFTVGGGQTRAAQFAFSAHEGPNGPSGYAVIKTSRYEAQGHVVCYGGNSPTEDGGGVGQFTFRVEQQVSDVPARFLHIVATDSGQPGGTGDVLAINRPLAPCVISTAFLFGGGAVTQGDIVVKN